MPLFAILVVWSNQTDFLSVLDIPFSWVNEFILRLPSVKWKAQAFEGLYPEEDTEMEKGLPYNVHND